jgi:heme-degrading monooxygenase HmoA
MRARVMTFYVAAVDMTGLAASLRSELPSIYASFEGFRGLLVLESPDERRHIIALTLWEDDESVKASESLAETIADRIAESTGTSVTRSIYNVAAAIDILDLEP